MRQLQLLGLFAITLAFAACGLDSQKESKTEKIKIETEKNWRELSEPDYSIHYPDTFDLDKSGQMGTSFILLSKQTSQQDLFRENVNLIIQDLKGRNINLDEYVEISEKQINAMLIDGKLIESKKLTNKSKDFHRVIYTGKQGQLNLKWQQLYWIENKKAYVLTFTCEINQYDNYVSVGEEIMNTFTIK